MSALIFDSHTHSKHSFDGRDGVFDLCLSAAEKGVSGLAITDHCDLGVYYRDDWREQLSALRDEIAEARERLGGRLRISFGVELGQPMHDEEKAQEVLGSFCFDVVLGSVHNVRGENDFYFLADQRVDRKLLMDRYFAEQLELARRDDVDVLTHLTYAYRYWGHGPGTPEPRQYEELLRELFKALAQSGKALELNTSGLYKTPPLETMPGLWELRLFRECGGEYVTLGSDAHLARFVAGGLERGGELLKEAGFRYQTFFQSRKPETFKL